MSLQKRQPLRAVLLLLRAHKLEQDQTACENEGLLEALIFALNTAVNDAAHNRNWSRAIQLGKYALELVPKQANTLSNIAVAALRTHQLDQALAWSGAAVELEPLNPAVLNNHATVLQEQGDLTAAKKIYLKVLDLSPNHENAKSNLACLAHQSGALREAEGLYQDYLSRNPMDSRVWVNFAGVKLTLQKFEEGWSAYQKRLDDPAPIMDVPPGLGLWVGGEQKIGRLIVVHEQGLGDSFQFCRFLPSLHKRANNIVFSGPNKLHGLLRNSSLVNHCWDPSDPKFKWLEQDLKSDDRWVPLMNLAPLLNTKQKINCSNPPYLKAKTAHIQRWSKTLISDNANPLIALHWQGNPEHEFTISRGRSILLRQLEPILEITGPQWLSLQKGPGSEQIDALQWRKRFHHAQANVDTCWDFEETAAILMNCDLVITSDSGLAHLAAGLGRPTWLLLMHIPEWRWGLNGAETPWYPSMRLFRQEIRGDWKGVVEQQVVPALQHWLKQKSLQTG